MKALLLSLIASTAVAQGFSDAPGPGSVSVATTYAVPITSGKVCFNNPTNTVCLSLTSTTLTLSGTTTLHVTGGSTTDGFAFFVGAQFSSNVIVQGTLQIGAAGNAITASFSATSVIDFAATTSTTLDSSGITVTGAAVGAPCIVGVPVAAAVTGASFTCYVSATDTVKIRFMAQGAAIDPASGTFTVRTF